VFFSTLIPPCLDYSPFFSLYHFFSFSRGPAFVHKLQSPDDNRKNIPRVRLSTHFQSIPMSHLEPRRCGPPCCRSRPFFSGTCLPRSAPFGPQGGVKSGKSSQVLTPKVFLSFPSCFLFIFYENSLGSSEAGTEQKETRPGPSSALSLPYEAPRPQEYLYSGPPSRLQS